MFRTTLVRTAMSATILAVLGLLGWANDGDGTDHVWFATGDAAAASDAFDALDGLGADTADVDFQGAIDELVADGLGLPGNEAGNSYDDAIHPAETYGDDVELDALWDACADGDLAACDALYLASPIDSTYEDFGDSCGGRQFDDTAVWCAED